MGRGDGPETETLTTAEGGGARGGDDAPDLPSRFRVTRVLGRGGMGIVVEAHDRALGREVAVKYLPPDRRGAERAVRFVREARAAALVDHPGIVTVHDVDPDGAFIVMELVRGESLAQRLARGPLPVDETLRIARALLAALAAAHRAGVVHRDIKPGNVLLGDGVVKLADFGVATFDDQVLTATGVHVGTPAYMAPEQLRGRGDDPRVDVYAAGATIFEMLTGRRLHGDDGPCGNPAALIHERTGSRALAAAIAAAVRERPEERPCDADALLASLEAPVRRSRAPVIGVAIVALGAAGGLAMYARGGSPPPPAAMTAPAATPRVAMASFDDRTGDPRLDYARIGLPHLLTTVLQRIGGIEVIDRQRLEGQRGDAGVDAWWTAARDADATHVVEGAIEGQDPNLRVEVRVRSIDGAVAYARAAETSVSGLPDVVRTLALEVAASVLGHPVGPPPPRRLDAEAEQWIARGIGALEELDFTAAADHLRRAAFTDPNSSEARYYLAIALWWQSAPADEVRGPIAQIDRDALTASQRAFLAGLELLLEHRYADAAAHFAVEVTRFPEDRDVLYGWYEALFHGGQPAAAIEIYRRLRTAYPRFELGVIHVLDYLILHGDHDQLTWALSLVDTSPTAPGVTWLGKVATAERRYRDAIGLFQDALDSTQTPPAIRGYLRWGEARVYAIDGQLEFARTLTRGADPGVDSDLGLLWGLAAAAGDPDEVRDAETAFRAMADDAQPGVTRMGAYLTIAMSYLAGDRPADDLTTAAAALTRATPAERAGDMVPAMVHVLLACRTGDAGAIERAAASTYDEVRAAVAACRAEQVGALDDALARWREALAVVSDGRLALLEHLEIARLARALARPAEVQAACREVVTPRAPVDAWGMAMPRCRLWLVEAALASGDRTTAAAEIAALAQVRGRRDPVLLDARARLAAAGGAP